MKAPAATQRIIDSFASLATKPQLSLVALVVETDTDKVHRAADAFIARFRAEHPEPCCHWTGTPLTRPKRKRTLSPDRSARRWFAFGDHDTWGEFCEVAAGAATITEHATALPAFVSGTSVTSWVWSLFDLAWQSIPGLPLRAAKIVPFDGGDIDVAGPIAKGWTRADWYYSVIGNAAPASLDALTFIVERSSTGSRGGRKPRGMSPLTDAQRKVYDAIAERQPIKGKGLAQATGIDQGTITKHIIPVLNKLWGVRNKPGAGYYILKGSKRPD